MPDEDSSTKLSTAGGRLRSHRVSTKTLPVPPNLSPVAQHRCRQIYIEGSVDWVKGKSRGGEG